MMVCLLLVVWEAGQNGALPLVVWILSTHTSDNCVLSCFLPMSVHFLQYLHPPTLHLAGLKITVKSDRHTLVTQY